MPLTGVFPGTVAPDDGDVMIGVAGAVMSVMKNRPADAGLMLPEASIERAVMVCGPSVTVTG